MPKRIDAESPLSAGRASSWTRCCVRSARGASTCTSRTCSSAGRRETAIRGPRKLASCRPYLDRQIELLAPTLILAVGRIAAQTLLHTDQPLGKLRGRIHALGERAWPVIVTYHPAYLLRSPGEKRKAWQDLMYARRTFRELERARGVA